MLPVCPCDYAGAVFVRCGFEGIIDRLLTGVLAVRQWSLGGGALRGQNAAAVSSWVFVRVCRELAFGLLRAAEALSGNWLVWDGKEIPDSGGT